MHSHSNETASLQNGVSSHRLDATQYENNFQDLHPPLSAMEARIEAERCYFCYDAPCTQACPTDIDIPQFIRQIASHNALGASHTIFKNNIMGAMCARVCPTEELCEQVCVRQQQDHEPVQIGRLQRFATDIGLTEVPPFKRAPDTHKKIAVVGAGPAGLSCAHALAREGHQVVVFERRQKAGGLNEHGIATYKACDEIAQREIEFILSIGGIEVKDQSALGEHIELQQLRAEFDAVFLAVGLQGVRALSLDNAQLPERQDAVGFIEVLRQSADVATIPIGRRVVVIGGGMTAVDMAIQAKLLGAEQVTMAYRGALSAMKASEFEQSLAQNKGVRLVCDALPHAVLASNGAVTGVRFTHALTGERFDVLADMVFSAIGQLLDEGPLHGEDGTLSIENGRIQVNEQRRTSLSNVWAGGDCVAISQDLTVAAVQDGKIAAAAIHEFLQALSS